MKIDQTSNQEGKPRTCSFERLCSRIHNGTDPYSPDGAIKFLGHPFAWLVALMKPVAGKYLIALFLDFVVVGIGIWMAPITGKLVDEVLIGGESSKLALYAAILALAPILRAVLRYIFRVTFEICSHYGMLRLRNSIYEQIQTLDRRFYHKNSTGQLMAKLTGDLDMLRHFWAWTFWVFLDQLLTFLVGGFYLFFISYKLTLACLLLTPLIVLTANIFRRKIRPTWSNIRTQFERLNAVVQQNISANRIVRAFVRQEYETDRFEKENDAYRDCQWDMVSVSSRYIPILEAFSGLINIPLILIGGLLAMRGEITIGELVAFSSLLFVFENPMRSMGNQINEIQRASTSAVKLCELLASPSELDDVQKNEASDPLKDEATVKRIYSTRSIKKRSQISIDDIVSMAAEDDFSDYVNGDIEFHNVSFSYHGEEAVFDGGEISSYKLAMPVLKNISLKISQGQRVGFIGATGSGKSSLIRLISRLYDPQEGYISIASENLKYIPLHKLRKSISVVNQEVFLFSDTVESNIAFSRPLLPTDEVVKYAKLAAADKFILNMEDGYETVVGERGVGLSGGQKQRLSLARALAAETPIIILDDTTSALDMETDKLIRDNLSSLKDKTIILIAQRIASLRDCDQIFVMEDGEIAEHGTHEELVKLNGIYADIYRTQRGQTEEAWSILSSSDNESSECDTKGVN